MAKNINTTKSMEAPVVEPLFDQGIEKIRQLSKNGRFRDIKIYKGSEDKTRDGQYVGVNGFAMLIPRGQIVPMVPELVLEQLDQAGVQYSKESGWKNKDGSTWISPRDKALQAKKEKAKDPPKKDEKDEKGKKPEDPPKE
jgi:hypothetical protein